MHDPTLIQHEETLQFPIPTIPRQRPDNLHQPLTIQTLLPRQLPRLPLQPHNYLPITRLLPHQHLSKSHHDQPKQELNQPLYSRVDEKEHKSKTYHATSALRTEHTYPGYRSLLTLLVNSTNATSTSVLIVSETKITKPRLAFMQTNQASHTKASWLRCSQ